MKEALSQSIKRHLNKTLKYLDMERSRRREEGLRRRRKQVEKAALLLYATACILKNEEEYCKLFNKRTLKIIQQTVELLIENHPMVVVVRTTPGGEPIERN